jgi:large subunit ribosomal protein L15
VKLHDLHPAPGSRRDRTRVGRGIAAGKGKTAGRGTKGQKARAGASIPAWFEGGQTPIHIRVPKLRGFKNRFKIEYEIVNVGAIEAAAERGAFEQEAADAKPAGKTKAAPQITVNQDILRAVGLVRSLNKPLKILGNGELSTALFVVADAFTASARTKIEAAGGSVNVLEVPTAPLRAMGVDGAEERTAPKTSRGAKAASALEAKARAQRTAAPEIEEAEAAPTRPSKAEPKAETEAPAATADADATTDETAEAAATEPEPATADADEAATTKPRRATKTRAAEPATDTDAAPETEAASAASDEAATPSGDDA